MPVRDAVPEDLPTILAMLHEHAISEAGLDPAAGAELEAALFGEHPTVDVTVAERVAAPGTVVGLAMWYWMFSSWTLASGIWLDDLYVDPRYRKDGLGRELMADLRTRTRGRIDWEVGAGNEQAERFYARLGAAPVPGWTRYRWLPDQP
jgi:GNAT superfamily N-acetyltransferase